MSSKCKPLIPFCRRCSTRPQTSLSVRCLSSSSSSQPSPRKDLVTHPIRALPRSHVLKSVKLSRMSSSFSNADVPGDKPADPYKAANKSEPELKEKVEDLRNFVSSCKFGMMTTRIGSSGLLTSRCMAVAAKVQKPYRPHISNPQTLFRNADLKLNHIGRWRP